MAASMTVPAVRARKGDTPLVMVTAYDAPGARMADEAGVDLILVGDSVAMVVLGYDDTLQVTIDDMAHHVAAVARTQAARARRRRPAVAELPRVDRRHRAQRGDAHPRRRASGEARRRPQARADDRGDRRRRDPGDGPHRPHAAVGPRDGRLQGAGQQRPRPLERSSTTPRRSRTPAASRSCSRACPTRSARLVTDAVSVPDDRHRRRRRTATARCSCSTTCSASRTASRRSSCAATPRSKPTASRRSRRSPTTCATGRFPTDDESYHLSDDVADVLGLYASRARVPDALP